MTSLSTFALIRAYARRFGADDCSAFLLFRLAQAVIVAFFTLGMPVALQRTVAFLSNTPARAGAAALVGLAMGVLSVACACAVAAIFATPLAKLMDYGNAVELWQTFMLLTVTASFASMVTFVQLARGRILECTCVSLASIALAPWLSLWVVPADTSFARVMMWTAVFTALAAAPSLCHIVGWAIVSRPTNSLREAVGLLRYGLPRTLSNGLEFTMEAVVPWLAAGAVGLERSTPLVVGLAIVRLLNPISVTLTQLLIPSAAVLAAAGDRAAQQAQTQRATEGLLHIGLFVTILLVIWCDVVIVFWLGHVFDDRMPIIRLVVVSIMPVFLYNSLRGILDGATEVPINVMNLTVAFGVLLMLLLAGGALGLGETWSAAAYLAGRVVLASLCLRAVVCLHELSATSLHFASALFMSVLLGLVNLTVRWLLTSGSNGYGLPVVLWGLSAMAYFFFMKWTGAFWPNDLLLVFRSTK